MKPIIKCNPVDSELCSLLGDSPRYFLVLYLNGERMERFGTPEDTPKNREIWDSLIADLNNPESRDWEEFFTNWFIPLCRQFKFPIQTTHKDFRPVVDYRIHESCHAYSQMLGVAIRLFEEATVKDKVRYWTVSSGYGISSSAIIDIHGYEFGASGKEPLSMLITKTVVKLLKAWRSGV